MSAAGSAPPEDEDQNQNQEPLRALSQPDPELALLEGKDNRRQRWWLYVVLVGTSVAYMTAFLAIVVHAWLTKSEASIIAFGKMNPSAAALIGAVIASMVAIPLSTALAVVRMITSNGQQAPGDGTAATSALFELGRAFAQGLKSIRGDNGS